MKRYLVRHAKAGDRAKWDKPDHLRPLTKSGREQAEGLVGMLDGVSEVYSSPYVRCVETVEPVAAAHGLAVIHHDALAEGAALDDALGLIEGSAPGAVLCSHGDVIGDVIAHLARTGVVGADPRLMKKGSVWVLEGAAGMDAASYLTPPA